MANKIFNTRIKNKRDTEANWTSKNPVLLNGEIIVVDTASGETRFKVGDGAKKYSQLPFQDAATLGNYVPTTRKVNSKALSSDISLTASDVGALPSTTTALKNPHALTFTGAVTGSYDGSAAKSVAIPSVDSSLSSTSTNAIQNKAVNTALSGKASTAVATKSANGLMSSSDKSKLDGIADGANKTIIDSSLSTTSTNPVQNKVINTALSGKASTSVATTSANGLMSASDKTKLNGIATGANKTTVDSALSTTSTNPVQNKAVKAALDSKLNTSGGTLTGNLTGQYLTGTWLQTTDATDLGSTPGKIAVLDESGWVYYRTPAEIKSDIGANGYLPTAGGTMTGAVTTKGIKLTSGTDFGSSLPSSLQSNQLFFQTLGTNYILDNVYPVGSIYMSVNSTNPKNLFGGTWEQIQGKFLFGMNSNYPAGSTGGEITHKLTQAEMPKHNHIIYTPNAGGPDVGADIGFPEVGSKNTWWAVACMTGQTGDNEAHNNMPPYLSVYIWKRTK